MGLTAAGPGWQPRLWVGLATQAFAEGVTQVLVGTRALLGEGWDAPCVNCLVDLSATTTSMSVTQMRGRSLRLDPDDPKKIASNWDIVAVAPELARGTADYERFVRKHLHLFAPSEDGAIEAGPSHVHPGLGPFAPPAEKEFDESVRERLATLARTNRAPLHTAKRRGQRGTRRRKRPSRRVRDKHEAGLDLTLTLSRFSSSPAETGRSQSGHVAEYGSPGATAVHSALLRRPTTRVHAQPRTSS